MKKTALFAIVLVLILIVVNLSAMKLEGYFQDDGYIVSNQNLDLLITEQEATSLTPIALMDEILSRFDGFFCNQGKTKLNMTYPQYTQDGLSLRFFNENAVLIANDFYSLSTYEGLYLNNGISYNSDRTRADLDEFIFAKLENGHYYFAQEAQVDTIYEQHVIPTNSLAILRKDAIQYLAFNEGKLEPQEVTALNGATITIGENQYDYYSLFSMLQGISTQANEEGTDPPSPEKSQNPSASNTPSPTITPGNTSQPTASSVPVITPTRSPSVSPSIAPSQSPGTTSPGPNQPSAFIPPKVTMSSTLNPWVYNVSGSLEIEDENNSLYRGVQVYIYYANTDRLYMRKTVRTSGEFTIGILVPDTEFDLSVSFKYRTPSKEKYDVVVTETPLRFKTLSRDELVPVLMNLQNVNDSQHIYYPNQAKINKIEFSNLLENSNEAEGEESQKSMSTEQLTVDYISKVQSSFTVANTSQTQTINLPAGLLKRIKEKESIDWLTTPVLESNTEYDYSLKIYDAFNVELPLDLASVSKGRTKTSKIIPIAVMNLVKNNVDYVQFNLTVENPDQAEMKEIYMELKNAETQEPVLMQGIVNGKSVLDYRFELIEDLNQLVLNNLPSSQAYDLYVYSKDIDTGDNLKHENVLLLKQSFFTESMLTLGKAYYVAEYKNVKATSGDIWIKMGTRTNELLKNFIDEIDLSIKHKITNISYGSKITKEKLDVTIELGELVYVDEHYEYVIEDNEQYRMIIIGKNEHDLVNPWEAIMSSSEFDNTTHLKIEFKENALKSNSIYNLQINTMASQGGVRENVTAVNTYEEMVTQKKDAKVVIENQFTASNFHDIYNFRINDLDGAVVGEKLVVMRLYDGQTMISTKTLEVNKTYDTQRFANLQENKQYRIEFIAVEYNNTSDPRFNQTYKQIGQFEFSTSEGVVSKLTINNTELSYADNFESISESNLARKAKENGQITSGHYMYYSQMLEDVDTSVIKLEVEPGEKYVVMNLNPHRPTDILAVFHNDKNVYVGLEASGMPRDIDSMTSAVITAPANAKYMYVNINNYYLTTVNIMKYEEDYVENAPNIMHFDNGHLSNILNIVGEITGVDSFDTTDYLEISGSQFYQIEVPYGRLVFYDSSKRAISFTYTGKHKSIYQSPSNAKYIRLSYSKNSNKADLSVRMYRPVDINRINANFQVKLNDKKQALVKSPFYSIRLFRTELVNESEETAYELYDEFNYDIPVVDGKTQDIDSAIVVHNIPRNYSYKAVVFVELYGSEIQLDTIYFNTASRVESIYAKNDFAKIIFDPTANYMVYNDIETTHSLLGAGVQISGVVDFNGYSITSYNLTKGIFGGVGPEGTVKNVVVNNCIDKTVFKVDGMSVVGFVQRNSGVLKDLIVNIDWEFDNANKFLINNAAVVQTVYPTGVIDGFVLNLIKPLHVGHGGALIAYQNIGTIQNGWIYGETAISVDYGEWDESLKDYVKRNNYYRGAVAFNAGKLSNIFNQVEMVVGKERVSNFSSIAHYQMGIAKDSASFANYYEFDPYAPEGFQLTSIKNTYNLVHSITESNETSNLVNFSQNLDTITGQTYGSKGELQWLWDYKWYNSNFNSQDGFDVYNLVTSGYYPQVKMNKVMDGKQPYNKLPTVVLQEQDMTYAYVESQTIEDAVLVLTINNPQNYKTDNVEIDGLTTEVIGQGWDDTHYRVKVRVSNPTKFYSKYTLNSIHSYNEEGSSVKTTYGPTSKYGVKTINAEFYRPIYSVSDWSNLRADPSQNFRLRNDIDFNGVTDFKNLIFVNLVFSGKFDGGKYEGDQLVGQYSLSNITTGNNTMGSVFARVTGTIENLVVDNFTTVNHNPVSSAGFIGTAQSASINNVHIRNSKITGSGFTGALVGLSSYQTAITNSSVADTSIIGVVSEATDLSIGGLVGYLTSSSIERSYVDNVIVDGSMANQLNGAGGFVGFGYYSTVKDVYATGKVYGTGSYTAGIVGQVSADCTITSSWNDMDISSRGNSVTSIGNIGSVGLGGVRNNVSFSAVSSKFSDATEVSRMINSNNSSFNLIQNNYAYKNQLINGKSSTELMDANFLVGKEELKSKDYWLQQIQFGNNFAYDAGEVDITGQEISKSITDGYLPMLLGLDGVLIYGQKPHQYRADLSYTQNQAEYNTNTFEFIVSLTLNHEGYTVLENFSMDGANDVKYSYSTNSADSNLTTFEITGKIVNAWDSYTLSIPLKNKTTNATTMTTIQIEFDSGPVYKNIENRSAWNQYLSSKRNTYENIMIVGDIDFTNYNPEIDVLDVMINRLSGQIKSDQTFYKITNLNFKSAYAGQSPFSKITTVDNIGFENIHIKDTKTPNALGVIKYLLGTMDKVHFETIGIEYNAGSSIGAIGNMQGSSITNVSMKNYDYKSTHSSVRTNFIGGLVGYGSKTTVYDTITVEGDCLNGVCTNTILPQNGNGAVSGLVGMTMGNSKITNVHIGGVNVKSQGTVQGVSLMNGGLTIIGNSSIRNSIIESTNADSYGFSSGTGTVTYGTADNMLIEAYTMANGISRSSVYNTVIKNSSIRSLTTESSGIGSTVYSNNNTVDNCHILAENINNEAIAYAGGLRGNFISNGYYNALYNTVINSVIQSNGNQVGGLFGSSKSTGIFRYNTIINTKILGKDQVGGIVGQSNSSKIANDNMIVDSEIAGGNYVGGILGAGGVLSATGNIIDEQTKITGSGSAVGGIAGFQKYVDASSSIIAGVGKQNIVGATITGADYVGGFYGIFDIGASLTDWPQNGGVNIGIPTEIIPGSAFSRMIFTGSVNGKGSHQSYVANGLNNSDLEGSTYVGLYENAQMTGYGYAKDDNRYTSLINGFLPTNVPKTLTSKQLANPELYRNQLLGRSELDLSTAHMLYTGKQELVVTKTSAGIKIENVSQDGPANVQLTANRVTENSYVKEGLVTWFDGKNNSGFNQQNTDAVVWKNLAGVQDAVLKIGANDLVVPANEMRFDSNGLAFNTINKTYFAEVANLEKVLEDKTNVYSFEIAFDAELGTLTTPGYGALLSVSKNPTDTLSFGVNGNQHLFYIGQSKWLSPSSWNTKRNLTMSFTSSKVDETNNIESVYENGIKTNSVAAVATGVSMTSMQIGTGTFSSVAKRNIYSIRVYDRSLTEVEIKQNDQVDQLIYRTYKDKLPSDTILNKEVIGGAIFITNAELAALHDIGALTVEIDNQSILIDYGSMKASELVLVDDSLTKIGANTILEGSPKIKVEGATGPVTWYRLLDYAKTGKTAVDKVMPDVYTSIAGRGYYYCEDSVGKQSDIIFVKDGAYLPYIAVSKAIVSGSEGYSEGKANDVTDQWYQGGASIPGYKDLVAGRTNRSRNSGNAKMMDTKNEMEKSFSKYGYRIYASDVDKMNLEFKDLDRFDADDRLIVRQDDQVIMNERISQSVYSFAYDYQTPVSIEIEQKGVSIYVPLNPSLIANSIMTYKEDYYYLEPSGVSSKTNVYNGQYIHLMNGKALSTNKEVLDLKTNKVVSSVNGITKLDVVVPLYVSGYGEQYLRSFAYLTEFYEQHTSFIKQGLFVSKDQRLINLPNDGSILINGFIKNYIHNKDIFAVVSNKGKLLDLTHSMNIPKVIDTENIKEITHNLFTNETVVLLRYESGAISGFNYISGEVLDLVQPKEIETDLLDYITGSIDTWLRGIPVFASSYNDTLLFSELIDGNADILYGLSNLKNENTSNITKRDTDEFLMSEKETYFSEFTKGQMATYKAQAAAQTSLLVYNEEKGYFESYNKETYLNEESPKNQEDKIEELQQQGVLIDVNKPSRSSSQSGMIRADLLVGAIATLIMGLLSYFVIVKVKKRNSR